MCQGPKHHPGSMDTHPGHTQAMASHDHQGVYHIQTPQVGWGRGQTTCSGAGVSVCRCAQVCGRVVTTGGVGGGEAKSVDEQFHHPTSLGSRGRGR